MRGCLNERLSLEVDSDWPPPFLTVISIFGVNSTGG